MILYFSGTGNSKYVAKRIADALGDALVNLNDHIKASDTSSVETGERVIIVTPTYAWRIPRVVRDWLLRTEPRGAKQVWFVMTCGGEHKAFATFEVRPYFVVGHFHIVAVFNLHFRRQNGALRQRRESDARHLVSPCDEFLCGLRAQKPGATNHKHLHFYTSLTKPLSPCSARIAIQRCMPYDTEEMICRINYIEYVYLPASAEWLSPFGSNISALQFEGIVTAYVQPFSVFSQPQTTFPYAL